MSEPTEAQRGYRALEHALRSGRIDDVPESLRSQPGYPDVVDPYTGTPLLLLALSWAPVGAVDAMLAAGADPNVDADDGFPAVLSVVVSDREDREELVRHLVAVGADIDRRGINGWTPLHAAANRNDAPMVELLLELGADPTVRTGVDDDGTALDEARRVGARDAVAALERTTS